jgi:hypothetical protein
MAHTLAMSKHEPRAPGGSSAVPEPSTADETRADLLERSGREFAPIRKVFVQQLSGAAERRSVLSSFVNHRDLRALKAYLFLLAINSSGKSTDGWSTTLDLQVWARAFDTTRDAEGASATAAVSKTLTRLEERRLITRERRGRERKVRVTLLREDGSGEPYTRPLGENHEHLFLSLSYAYWADGWHAKLSLPATAMLLVALHEKPVFRLPTERMKDWYGWSPDTAERGFAQLEEAGLLEKTTTWTKAPLSPSGLAKVNEYRLLGPFQRKPAGKASAKKTVKTKKKMLTRRTDKAASTRKKASS